MGVKIAENVWRITAPTGVFLLVRVGVPGDYRFLTVKVSRMAMSIVEKSELNRLQERVTELETTGQKLARQVAELSAMLTPVQVLNKPKKRTK